MVSQFLVVMKESVNEFLDNLTYDDTFNDYYKNEVKGEEDELHLMMEYVKKKFNERFEQ